MATGYINIRGRGLKFCQGSVSLLQAKIRSFYKGITPDSTPEDKEKINNSAKEIIMAYGGYWLAHFGLEGNCIVKGEDITFTFEDTVEWMESLNEDEILQIQAAYDSTHEYIKDIPESAKKKIVKKK